jgi:hypothetical protein
MRREKSNKSCRVTGAVVAGPLKRGVSLAKENVLRA